MAIRLEFTKSADETPWGFRLTGGADCEIPLTVIKIAEGGIAETAGLKVGDVIIKINEYSAEHLSHMEAHDVLTEAGQNYTMTVVRNPIDHVHEDEQHNEEVIYILGDVQDQIQPETDEAEHEAEVATMTQQKTLRVHFEDTDSTKESDQQVQQKKWSTFLQKPSRPVVSPKRMEPERHIGEPYRVIIKKQPKKTTEVVESEPVEEMSTNTEFSDFECEAAEPSAEEYEVVEETTEVNEDKDGDEDQVDFVEEQEIEETDDDSEVEEAVVEKSATLEEQLAQIQQHLQSLAQVPTSIQNTLEALTEELAKIVGSSHSQQNLDQEVVQYEEVDDDEHSCEDENLQSVVEEVADVLDSSDEYKLDITDASDISEDEADDSQTMCKQTITSEELLKLKQAEEDEREKLAKQERVTQAEEHHQRRLEQRPTVPLAPVQRPIILPGGRKWSDPDDAVPKPRKSKMTDEKICETLDNYSEILTGHTKGINFLKYQPAPKNLDYLQRSEVFRLIHDMDTPKSGIASRTGLVVSEEDYYKHNSEQPTAVKV